MNISVVSGKDIVRTLFHVYPDWQHHGLDVIKSREVKGDLILWLIQRRPGIERDVLPQSLWVDHVEWIWEAFRDDHPGRLYEMYSTVTWEWLKEDVFDELMQCIGEYGATDETRH
jgi:hypothetical protein